MRNRHDTPHPGLGMHQQLGQPYAGSKAALLLVMSEIAALPPTPEKLRHWSRELQAITQLPPRAQAACGMLRRAIVGAIAGEQRQRQVWDEYERLLNPNRGSGLNPYASAHCDAATMARLNREQCPYEAGKSCPFGDYRCVNRIGAPCDYLASALKLASLHWRDFAVAVSGTSRRRAYARCRKLERKNLALWVDGIAQKLFLCARTPLYQAEALLVDALLESA